eukprot:5177176-Karenia_brevis.AAC.1
MASIVLFNTTGRTWPKLMRHSNMKMLSFFGLMKSLMVSSSAKRILNRIGVSLLQRLRKVGPLSGVPNKLFSQGSFVVVTWNARALLNQNISLRRKKRRFLESELKRSAVTCLQEVHGFREEFDATFDKHDSSMWQFFSPGSSRADGGISTHLSHRFFDKDIQPSYLELVPGRISRTLATSVKGLLGGDTAKAHATDFAIWNFHNFNISGDDFER